MNVYFYDENFDHNQVTDPFYYLIAKNGMFTVSDSFFGKVVQEVNQIDGLVKLEGEFIPSYPKIPMSIIYQALEFFKEVYNKHYAEAIVILFYSPLAEEYFIDAPKQKVSYANLNFDATEIFDYYPDDIVVGSIHSHGSMNAFHSNVDLDDEIYWDGIHITIGNVNTSPSFEASYQIGGSRFKTDINEVVDHPMDDFLPLEDEIQKITEEKQPQTQPQNLKKYAQPVGNFPRAGRTPQRVK